MPPDLPSEFEQQVLLALLRLDTGAYGASIRKELERQLRRDVSQGALYTTLVRLEKKGFVRSRMSDPTPVRGGKARRVFTVTPEGARGVEAARAAMNRLWDGLSEPDTGGATG